MTTINDAMFTALKALHPDTAATLGDLLHAENLSPRLGSYSYYIAALEPLSPLPTTWSDAAFAYWTDPDYVVSNLELETGNDLLLEDGSFMLLEAGNV